jgi:hypothetical protein
VPAPTVETHEVDEPLSMTGTALRVLGVVAVLAMTIFWIWIFAGGPKKVNPDRLDDRAFVTRTAERCDDLRADLADLPNAASIDGARARADVLDRATDLVDGFIAATRADAPKTGDDARSVRGWLGDWETYSANRRDFADRLRKDPKARFLLDANEAGDPIDKPIEIFAQVNDMKQCATPGDVG